jgi:hypothetical protein
MLDWNCIHVSRRIVDGNIFHFRLLECVPSLWHLQQEDLIPCSANTKVQDCYKVIAALDIREQITTYTLRYLLIKISQLPT